MVLFDLLAGVLLALLLRRHGRDVRRAFIYLWAPLPVIEFAFSGHVDAAAIAFILLILLLNGLSFRGSRALIGGLLGIATLIKFYPLVLVVALLRRRDWALLGTLAATLVVGYAPYAHDGLASFGFLSTYLTELDTSYGGAVLLIRAVGFRVGLTPDVVRALGVLGAAAGAGVVFWLRVRPEGVQPYAPTPEWGAGVQPYAPAPERPVGTRLNAPTEPDHGAQSAPPCATTEHGEMIARRVGAQPASVVAPTEAGSWLTRLARRGTRRWRAWDARVPRGVRLTPIQASFALIALWLAFSPHVFPWYTAALLPFVALELTLPPRRLARGLVAGAWVFCGLIPLAYVAFEYSAWYWLYAGTYLASLAVVLVPLAWWLARGRTSVARHRPNRWGEWAAISGRIAAAPRRLRGWAGRAAGGSARGGSEHHPGERTSGSPDGQIAAPGTDAPAASPLLARADAPTGVRTE
jgi:hypothetical protein